MSAPMALLVTAGGAGATQRAKKLRSVFVWNIQTQVIWVFNGVICTYHSHCSITALSLSGFYARWILKTVQFFKRFGKFGKFFVWKEAAEL